MTTEKYFEAVGRRKTAIARARLTVASQNSMVINGKPVAEFFKTADLQNVAMESLLKSGAAEKFKITVKVVGGGVNGQAEAIRHAVARALLVYDINLRKTLKKEGHLTRDQRAKERRKFGLKKARKSAQWSKR